MACRARFGRWLGLTGSLLGGFYVFALLGTVLHETVGHGLLAVWCGGRFDAFHVSAGLGGWAQTHDVPEPFAWISLWGGIAVNLATGAAALLLLRRRGPHLSKTNLALFLVALTGLGQGVGYVLQGFLFQKGDPARLAGQLPWPARVMVIGVFALLFAWYLRWALRRVVVYLEEHYEPAGFTGRLRAAGLTILLPFGTLPVVRSTTPLFSTAEHWTFYSVVATVLLVALLVLARRRPPAADPARAHRPSAGAGLAWLAAAGAAAGATVLWLQEVHVHLG